MKGLRKPEALDFTGVLPPCAIGFSKQAVFIHAHILWNFLWNLSTAGMPLFLSMYYKRNEKFVFPELLSIWKSPRFITSIPIKTSTSPLKFEDEATKSCITSPFGSCIPILYVYTFALPLAVAITLFPTGINPNFATKSLLIHVLVDPVSHNPMYFLSENFPYSYSAADNEISVWIWSTTSS